LSLLEVTKFDEATVELKKALEVEPKNESLLQLQEKLRTKLMEYSSKQKQVYKSMFS